MLAKRVIPCLDVDRGRVVKGTNFLNLRDAGDPVEVAKRYEKDGADELVFLDISASHEGRNITADMVRRVAEVVFMPLTVGGGIRNLDDATALIQAGAEKVSVNDVRQIYDLKGEILLIKGSMIVTGDDGHIQVDPEGYEFIDVKCSSDANASFRQRREGPADEFINGRGAQVIYDAKTEILTITGDASLKRALNMQTLDQLHGWKIEYDDVKERYRVIPPADAKVGDLPLARAILSPRQKATLEK